MVELVALEELLKYNCSATDPDDLKCMLRMRKEFFLNEDGLNRDADALSRIPWEMIQVDSTPLDTVLVKSAILIPSLTQKIPHLPNAVVRVCELVIWSELELSKSQWK